jgi:hypothetical protein
MAVLAFNFASLCGFGEEADFSATPSAKARTASVEMTMLFCLGGER